MKNVILVLALTILVELPRTALEKLQTSKLDKNKQRVLEFLIRKIINDRKHEPRIVVPDDALSSSDIEETRDLSSHDSKENSDNINNESQEQKKKVKVYIIKVKTNNNHNALTGDRIKKILRNLDYYDERSQAKLSLLSTYPPKKFNKYIFSDELEPRKKTRRPTMDNFEKITLIKDGDDDRHKWFTTLADGEKQEYSEPKNVIKDINQLDMSTMHSIYSNDLDFIVESSSLSNNQMDINELPIQQTAILEVVDDEASTIAGYVKHPESEVPAANFEEDLNHIGVLFKKNFKEGGDNIFDTENRDQKKTESDLEQSAESDKLDMKNEGQLKYFLKNGESDTENEFDNENQLNKPKEEKQESDFDFEMQTEHVDWSENSKKKQKNKKVSVQSKNNLQKHKYIKLDSKEKETQDISSRIKNEKNLRHKNKRKKQKMILKDIKNNNTDPGVIKFKKEATTNGVRQTAMIFEVDKKYLSSKAESEETRHKNKNHNVILPGQRDKFKTRDGDNSVLLSSVLRSKPNAAFHEDGHGFSFKEDLNQDYFNDYP